MAWGAEEDMGGVFSRARASGLCCVLAASLIAPPPPPCDLRPLKRPLDQFFWEDFSEEEEVLLAAEHLQIPAQSPHFIVKVAGHPLLLSWLLASGPCHQHPRILHLVIFEFYLCRMQVPEDKSRSLGYTLVLTAAPWEPGVPLNCPCLLEW